MGRVFFFFWCLMKPGNPVPKKNITHLNIFQICTILLDLIRYVHIQQVKKWKTLDTVASVGIKDTRLEKWPKVSSLLLGEPGVVSLGSSTVLGILHTFDISKLFSVGYYIFCLVCFKRSAKYFKDSIRFLPLLWRLYNSSLKATLRPFARTHPINTA